jgi:beta-ribofuranosylaminobenzene 5'-phosphate synthase
MSRSHLLEVAAPSRLHFGLLSFGRSEGRQFGGAGAMVDSPGLLLRFWGSDELQADGPLADRVLHFAHSFAAHLQLPAAPACRIEVVRAPRPHSGLGVGTSLGMAVASGLSALWQMPYLTAGQLAKSVGRGRRSAVGVHGFLRGGLIVEAGKRTGEDLAPLVARVPLPAAWRFALIRPRSEVGLCGDAEAEAFARLPPIPGQVTRSLRRELMAGLLPAARRCDFSHFSECLYRYGCQAGECFAERQGGAFASERLSGLVQRIRGMGVQGVGQSSWGPTLFALLRGEKEAEQFAAQLRSEPDAEDLEISLTAPNNTGARISFG